MAELSVDDQCDETHFWVYCPGCSYAGKIGVPHNYPADVVVCPSCHQVVNVRPEDRILWLPADETEFLRRRFPHNDWDNIDREPRPAPADDQPSAAASDPPAAPPGETPASPPPAAPAVDLQRTQSSNLAAVWVCAGAAVATTLMTLVTIMGRGPAVPGQRRPQAAVRDQDSPDAVTRNARAKANPASSPPSQPPASAPANQPAPRPAPPAAPAPVAPTELSWQELFDRAYQQVQAGEYARAVHDLTEVLRLNPAYAIALEKRMEALFYLGRYEQALADVNDEILLLPTKYRPLVSRAVVYEELGDWRRAVEDLRRALRVAAEAAPRNDADRSAAGVSEIAREIYDHAVGLYRDGEYVQAADLFTVLMRQLPGTAVLVLWRAACYQCIGAYDQALIDFNRGLSLPSAPAWGYVWRSTLHERNQDLEAAVLDMRKAVRLEPTRRDYGERLDRLERQWKYHPRPFPVRRPRSRTA